MCPLRFILVFFSAVLAGYFAWRSVRSSPEIDSINSDDSTVERKPLNHKREFNVKKVCLFNLGFQDFFFILCLSFLVFLSC